MPPLLTGGMWPPPVRSQGAGARARWARPPSGSKPNDRQRRKPGRGGAGLQSLPGRSRGRSRGHTRKRARGILAGWPVSGYYAVRGRPALSEGLGSRWGLLRDPGAALPEVGASPPPASPTRRGAVGPSPNLSEPKLLQLRSGAVVTSRALFPGYL